MTSIMSKELLLYRFLAGISCIERSSITVCCNVEMFNYVCINLTGFLINFFIE